MKIFRSPVTMLVFIALMVVSFSCSYKKKITATNIRLDPVYGSNMVFKRGDSIIIKGVSNVNGVLAVKLQDGLKHINADEKGRWAAKFPPFDYDGAFSISVEGLDQVIELNNLITGRVWVVIGDNWLRDTPENIYNKTAIEGRGANEKLRIYTPPSLYSEGKTSNGEWKILNVGKKNYREIFSGILGDELSTLNNEPIGIINLSCAGTSMRDFSGKERELVNSVYNAAERDSILDEYFKNQLSYQRLADSSFKGLGRDVLNRLYDDWDWTDVEFPLITKKRWYLKNRIVWLRKKIFIAGKYITSDFTIELGTLRGQFDFYFNGTHIANFKGESSNYKLQISDTLVKVWTNLLTIRMVAGDSLSGLYSKTPRVINADSSYRTQIAEDWTIRTYYEPKLPKINRNALLWPQVYSKYVFPLNGLRVNSVLLTGSVHQYANLNSNILSAALDQLSTSFVSQKNYMFLIPLPEYVDAMVNSNYYNTIRNIQMVSAAKENWDIINTMGVRESSAIQAYQREMVDRLINELR